jgi:hypothetical protein
MSYELWVMSYELWVMSCELIQLTTNSIKNSLLNFAYSAYNFAYFAVNPLNEKWLWVMSCELWVVRGVFQSVASGNVKTWGTPPFIDHYTKPQRGERSIENRIETKPLSPSGATFWNTAMNHSVSSWQLVLTQSTKHQLKEWTPQSASWQLP